MELYSVPFIREKFTEVFGVHLPEFSMLYNRVCALRNQGILADIRFGDIYPRLDNHYDVTDLITDIFSREGDKFIRPYSPKTLKVALLYNYTDQYDDEYIRHLFNYMWKVNDKTRSHYQEEIDELAALKELGIIAERDERRRREEEADRLEKEEEKEEE